MFQFIFRAFGMIVLALALVTAVLDVTRSVAGSRFIVTSLYDNISGLSDSLLPSLQASVEQGLHPLVWDPLLTGLLALPGWAILWLISMVLLWIGQTRRDPYGRFSSR